MKLTKKEFEDIKYKYEEETSTIDLIYFLNLQPSFEEQMNGKSTHNMVVNEEVDHNQMLRAVIRNKYGTEIVVEDGKLIWNGSK